MVWSRAGKFLPSRGIAQSMRSKGAHRLIRQGAKPVECVEDVLEEIRPLIRPVQSARSEKQGAVRPVPCCLVSPLF